MKCLYPFPDVPCEFKILITSAFGSAYSGAFSVSFSGPPAITSTVVGDIPKRLPAGSYQVVFQQIAGNYVDPPVPSQPAETQRYFTVAECQATLLLAGEPKVSVTATFSKKRHECDVAVAKTSS